MTTAWKYSNWGTFPLLRLSLAIVFAWFGALKLGHLCPLEGFIARSVPFLPAKYFLFTLGCWEVAIGVCLLVGPLVRVGLWLLLLHLPGTVLPLIVIPGECFTRFPFGLTLEGQYIVKNLVLASAAIVIAARYRRPQDRPRRKIPVAVPVRVGKAMPAVGINRSIRRGIPLKAAARRQST